MKEEIILLSMTSKQVIHFAKVEVTIQLPMINIRKEE